MRSKAPHKKWQLFNLFVAMMLRWPHDTLMPVRYMRRFTNYCIGWCGVCMCNCMYSLQSAHKTYQTTQWNRCEMSCAPARTVWHFSISFFAELRSFCIGRLLQLQYSILHMCATAIDLDIGSASSRLWHQKLSPESPLSIVGVAVDGQMECATKGGKSMQSFSNVWSQESFPQFTLATFSMCLMD